VKLATFAACVLGASTLVVVGCSQKKEPTAASGAALEVQPVATVPPAQTYTPPPAPAYGPIETTSPKPITFDPAPAAGKTYTVKKGDTLSKIAREHYGDVKAVRKITEANPGMNANAIKAGQQIVLP
jgi:nucleoid-associated protein YgaU